MKTIFLALENHLNFGLVLGPILVDFGSPKRPPKIGTHRMVFGPEVNLFGHVIGFCDCEEDFWKHATHYVGKWKAYISNFVIL